MAGVCKICRNPSLRQHVNSLLEGGCTMREIASLYPGMLSAGSVQRHSANHFQRSAATSSPTDRAAPGSSSRSSDLGAGPNEDPSTSPAPLLYDPDSGFEYPPIPSPEPSYEELKLRKIEDFQRLDASRRAAALIKVRVKVDGPYGVLVMGDPHVDADGTDWPTLDRHTQLARKTEGLFAANVGDITNNWIGRLARLYGEQSMSRSRALIMAEGWLREVKWLWIDPGNHDLWSGADDPVRWITRLSGVHYKWQGSRLELVPPTGASVVVNSRHDHPGYSMYHPTHGPLKASIWDGHADDIYTCGHIHTGGYMLRVNPVGKISHILRLSSYKVYDNHKDEKGFVSSHLPAGLFIVNPLAADPAGRVLFFADPEEGAEVLTFMRRAKAVQVRKAA